MSTESLQQQMAEMAIQQQQTEQKLQQTAGALRIGSCKPGRTTTEDGGHEALGET